MHVRMVVMLQLVTLLGSQCLACGEMENAFAPKDRGFQPLFEVVFFDCHVAPQPGWHESFLRLAEVVLLHEGGANAT